MKNKYFLLIVTVIIVFINSQMLGCSRRVKKSEIEYILSSLKDKYGVDFIEKSSQTARASSAPIPSFKITGIESTISPKDNLDVEFKAYYNLENKNIIDNYARVYVSSLLEEEFQSMFNGMWNSWDFNVVFSVMEEDGDYIYKDLIKERLKDIFSKYKYKLGIDLYVKLDRYKNLNYDNEQINCDKIIKELQSLGIKDYYGFEFKVNYVEDRKIESYVDAHVDYNIFQVVKNENKNEEMNLNYKLYSAGTVMNQDDTFCGGWVNTEIYYDQGISSVKPINSDTIKQASEYQKEIAEILNGNTLVLNPIYVPGDIIIIDLDYYNCKVEDIIIYNRIGQKGEKDVIKYLFTDVTDKLEYYKDNKYILISDGPIAIAKKKI